MEIGVSNDTEVTGQQEGQAQDSQLIENVLGCDEMQRKYRTSFRGYTGPV